MVTSNILQVLQVLERVRVPTQGDFGDNTGRVHANHATLIVDPGAPMSPRSGAGTGVPTTTTTG